MDVYEEYYIHLIMFNVIIKIAQIKKQLYNFIIIFFLENVLIFTREQFPTQETMSKVAIALKKNKLPETFYTKIDQTSCGQVDIEINPEAEYIDVEESTDVEEI